MIKRDLRGRAMHVFQTSQTEASIVTTSPIAACNSEFGIRMFRYLLTKGGEIRDTKTLNLSRNIVSLQVFVDVSRFSPGAINFTRNKNILLRVEEMRRADWLICWGTSKFVARQVVSMMKNEQQGQNLLLKVDPNSTFRNNFLQPATNVLVAGQVDYAR